MLASHVLGASWYLLSIKRQATCSKSECKNESGPVKCFPHYLECGTLDDNDQGIWENSTLAFNNCNPESTTSFINGMFENTLTNNVVLGEVFLLSLVGLTELEVCFMFAVLSHSPLSVLDDDNDNCDAVFQFK